MSILGDTYGLESMSIDLQFDFFQFVTSQNIVACPFQAIRMVQNRCLQICGLSCCFIYFVSFYVSRYSCMSILGDTYGIESMSKDSRFELFFYLFRLNKQLHDHSRRYVWPRIDLYMEQVQNNSKYIYIYIYIYTYILYDPYSKPYVWPRIDLYIWKKFKKAPNIYLMTPILSHTYGLESKSIVKYI